MANYSNVKGFTVQTLSSDPVASQAAGGSWASGGSMPAGKYVGLSAGTQTSNVITGGATDPPANSNQVNTTFEYDGSSWTAGGALNTTRFAGSGFGATNTAAIMVGGAASPGSATQPAVESYNGTSFTEVAELNTARGETFGGAGTSTAGVVYGGKNPGLSPGLRAETENWNGSAWTETADLNTARAELAGAGESYTAAIGAGGVATNSVTSVETWNGSAWTEVSDLSTAKYNGGMSGGSPSSIYFGGIIEPGTVQTATEFWNGSSWTEVSDLSTGRWGVGKSSSGTSASALCSGGNTGSEAVTNTEEFTAPSTFTKQIEGQLFFNSTTNSFKETILDVPAGAWSSGGNLNEGRPVGAGYGSSNLAAGLAGGENSTDNEAYNGTSWTEVNELNTARSNVNGTGSFTAGLVVGGYPPNTANVESWDGTSFTEVGDLNTGRGYQSGAGTANTANIAIGGFTSPPSTRLTICEQFDGSSWTEVGDLTRSAAMNSTGSTSGSPYTSALCIGGYNAPNSPNTYSDLVESWDGSSWTNSTAMSNKRTMPVGNGGSVTDVVVAGGGGSAARTEIWNGSSWTELGDPSISNKFRSSGGTASTTAGIMSGSDPGGAETEEWNAFLSNKTITSS